MRCGHKLKLNQPWNYVACLSILLNLASSMAFAAFDLLHRIVFPANETVTVTLLDV